MPPPPSNTYGFDIHIGKLGIAEGEYNPTLDTVTIYELGNHELAHPINLVGVAAEEFIDFIDFTHSGITTISDVRLKENTLPLGRLGNGLGMYRFRYKWSNQQYVGVMAQEVAETNPEAVVSGSDGYLRVDYGRLGLRMMTWDEWVTKQQSR